jgi:hypothetical protein
MFLDALKGCWILATFFFTFFWLPGRLICSEPDGDAWLGIASRWTRMTTATTAIVLLLSYLKCFNAVVLLAVLAAAAGLVWFNKHKWSTRSALLAFQAAILRLLRKIEAGALRAHMLRLRPPTRKPSRVLPAVGNWLTRNENRELVLLCTAVVIAVTTVLHTAPVFRELRFQNPEQYVSLLRVRELTLNLRTGGRPLIYPALIATTSLLSGADAMQVIRFLTPILPIMLFLSTGLLIYICTRMRFAAVAGMYWLGAGGFTISQTDVLEPTSILERIKLATIDSQAILRGSLEFELGLLFVVLALYFAGQWYRHARLSILVDLACCVLLVSFISPFLLLILSVAAVVLLLRPWISLLVLAVACYGMAVSAAVSTSGTIPSEVATTLPLAGTLALGLLLALIEATLIAGYARTGETIFVLALVAIAALWCPPHKPSARYLEYEAAAREIQRIAATYPRQRWLVAAPVEQLPETLGYGGYEDLATFVERYQTQVKTREFRFSETTPDLFIFVETRPFQIFSREPDTVSFPTLTDTTYRSYRSPAGRASLEADALQLCETYGSYHSNSEIFFEDENLRVYHIHQESADTI